MWAAHCRESPPTSPDRDGEVAQVSGVFSLSPTHQAGELIDAFRRKLQSDALSFGLLLIIRKFMEYALH
jgi:hypothetical protein